MPTDEAGRVALSHIRSDPRWQGPELGPCGAYSGRARGGSSWLKPPRQGQYTEEGRRRRAGPSGPLDTASGVRSTSPDAASDITDSTTVDPHRQEAARVADARGVLEDVQLLLRADTATKPGSVL